MSNGVTSAFAGYCILSQSPTNSLSEFSFSPPDTAQLTDDDLHHCSTSIADEPRRFRADDRIIRFYNDDGTIANVHESLLRNKCACFDDDIQAYQGEDKSQTVNIDLECSGPIENCILPYVSWLYNSKFGFPQPQETGVGEYDAAVTHYLLMIDLYSFGNDLGNIAFMDAVLDATVDLLEAPHLQPQSEHIWTFWIERMPKDTKMRRLLADWIVFNEGAQALSRFVGDTDMDDLEFLRATAAALADVVARGLPLDGEAPSDRDRCFHHVHKEKGLSCHNQG